MVHMLPFVTYKGISKSVEIQRVNELCVIDKKMASGASLYPVGPVVDREPNRGV